MGGSNMFVSSKPDWRDVCFVVVLCAFIISVGCLAGYLEGQEEVKQREHVHLYHIK